MSNGKAHYKWPFSIAVLIRGYMKKSARGPSCIRHISSRSFHKPVEHLPLDERKGTLAAWCLSEDSIGILIYIGGKESPQKHIWQFHDYKPNPNQLLLDARKSHGKWAAKMTACRWLHWPLHSPRSVCSSQLSRKRSIMLNNLEISWNDQFSSSACGIWNKTIKSMGISGSKNGTVPYQAMSAIHQCSGEQWKQNPSLISLYWLVFWGIPLLG